MASTILADNGASSGSAGIKTTADSTGVLVLQSTTSGGTATTAVTIDNSQNTTFAGTITGNGSGLTTLNATNLSSGTVGTARLGSGSASSSTYLRGDQTWSTISFSPAGSNTQIQYNSSGSFAGSANLTFDGTNILFNSGYGSAAVAYGCRAWVNWYGSTGGIRASGNVSSVTRNATGNYTVNLASAMPDANYAVNLSWSQDSNGSGLSNSTSMNVGSRYNGSWSQTAPTSSAVPVGSNWAGAGVPDPTYCNMSIYR